MSTNPKLLKFLDTLDENQLKFFFMTFPYYISDWFNMSYGGIQSVAPSFTMSKSKKVVSRMGTPEIFKDFLVAWYHLRQIYPPVAAKGKWIYRLTATRELPSTDKVVFQTKDQHKAATSWTLNPKPKVYDRVIPFNTVDIILSTKLQGSKHVMFDFESAQTLTEDVLKYLKGAEKFSKLKAHEITYAGSLWSKVEATIKDFRGEKEVVVYLNNKENLICDWVGVKG